MKRIFCRLHDSLRGHITGLAATTTLLLAGCATLATFQSASYGNDALLAQTQLSNCWSYYQAKSIKEHIFQLHRNLLVTLPDIQAADTITFYDSEIDRYRQEKYALMEQAGNLSQARITAEQQAISAGHALLLVQSALILSSLASVSHTIYYWYGSVLLGAGGLLSLVLTLR